MKITRPIKLLACIVIIILGCLKVKQIYGSMMHASRYTIVFDPLLSAHAKKIIKHAVEEKKNSTLSELVELLQTDMPFIQHITARHDIHNKDRFVISVKAYRPQKNINNSAYIAEGNKIIPRTIFIPLDLPIIHATMNPEELSPAMIDFIGALKKSTLQTYTVFIKNDNTIVLKNIQLPTINIITSVHRVPSKELIAPCQKIIEEKLTTYKGKKKLYGDIRFKNQIIMFEDREGKIE